MKTRSFLGPKSNIASIVKARRNILIEHEGLTFSQLNNESLTGITVNNPSVIPTNETANQSTIQPEKKVVIKTLWTLEDKIMFFTALKNFGKNFNEISRFIKNRCSRLNPKNGGKTKEQVRFFYNRTWNNIKPYLKFPVELLQSVQELYALINYSVFRTRIKKKLNPKLGEKLNEMVMNGSTVIKCNGKRITLRTPVCPALKKINNIKVPEQEYTIPDDVIIEMVPRNYVTLWRVQQIEQNPRMRLKVAMNRQLSDVIHFLSNKLKSNSQIIRESLSLPTVDPPKLHIRLSDEYKFYEEVMLQEVTKPRFDNITLRSYRDNILKAHLDTAAGKDPERSHSGAPNQSGEDESSYLKMNFGDIHRKLLSGVGTEDARDVKVLALYICLGCPSVIRFVYEYLHPGDVDTAQKAVSNGLRRLIHLGKHDFLEYENDKDARNKLKLEIAEMEAKLDEKKREFMNLNPDNFTEVSSWLDSDDQPCGLRSGQASNQNLTKDIYKKQEEALKQLREDLPNKNNVMVKRLEFSHDNNSLVSMKTFNKARKNPRSLNKNRVPALFTITVPLNVKESQFKDNKNEAVVNCDHYPNLFPLNSNDLFFNELEAQTSNTYHQHITTPNINYNRVPPSDHCDNTNDSLRSFLNDLERTVDDTHIMDYQNFYQQSPFNMMAGSPPLERSKPGDLDASISMDSNSYSLSHLLNTFIKSEKKS